MARLLLLLLLPLYGFCQSGRYQINTIETRTVDSGYVTITDYLIRIETDSIQTIPVTDRGEDRDKTFYILGGCEKGKEFRGAAILYATSSRSLGGGHRRYYFLLYVELRSRQSYSATRYSIFYDE